MKQYSKSVTTVNCFSLTLKIWNSSFSNFLQQGPWQAWQSLQSPSPRPASTTNPCLRLFPGPLIMRVNGVPHLPMQGNEGQSGVPQIFPGPGLRPQVTDPPDPQWAVALTSPHRTTQHRATCGAEWIGCDTTAKQSIVVNHRATQLHLVGPWYNGSKHHTWTHWAMINKPTQYDVKVGKKTCSIWADKIFTYM